MRVMIIESRGTRNKLKDHGRIKLAQDAGRTKTSSNDNYIWKS